ncbi:unnamed protein product, partial [Prorocentrum cordatum]
PVPRGASQNDAPDCMAGAAPGCTRLGRGSMRVVGIKAGTQQHVFVLRLFPGQLRRVGRSTPEPAARGCEGQLEEQEEAEQDEEREHREPHAKKHAGDSGRRVPLHGQSLSAQGRARVPQRAGSARRCAICSVCCSASNVAASFYL